MSASLIEMVMAIALAGLIFAGAVVPVTHAMLAYQESEADVQGKNAQHLAALRVEQVVASIWRQDDPPAEHGLLTKGDRNRLRVGSWDVREKGDHLLQTYRGGAPALLTQPAERLAFSYLLDDGTWAKGVKKGQFGGVVALRYWWTDSGSGATYRGLVLPTDAAFDGRLIELPKSESASDTYRWSDHERDIVLDVKQWR